MALRDLHLARRRAPGFTLVELLVVVAVIAALVAILLPSLRSAKDKAAEVVCRTNQQTILRAFVYYSREYHDRLPGVDGPEPTAAWWYAVDEYLDERIPPSVYDCRQVDMPQVMFCPRGKVAFPKTYMTSGQIEVTHYFLNGVEKSKGMGFGDDIRMGLFGGEGRITDPDSPSECMMMGELVNFNKIADLDHPAAIKAHEDAGSDVQQAWIRYHHRATAGFFHGSAMNVGYGDGHVAALDGIAVADEYSGDSSQWPVAMREDPTLFYPNLSLPSAEDRPSFWGPPYEDYEPDGS